MKPSEYLDDQILRLRMLEDFAETERPEFRDLVRDLGNGIAAAVATELSKWQDQLSRVEAARVDGGVS